MPLDASRRIRTPSAQFGQELLSTFGTTIGEIALIPATGGIFTVHLTYRPSEHETVITAGSVSSSSSSSSSSTAAPMSNARDQPADAAAQPATTVADATTAKAGPRRLPEERVERVLLWDRKAEGGFPETKVLKQRVRDCLEPGRDLGHSDRGGKKKKKEEEEKEAVGEGEGERKEGGEEKGKGGAGEEVKDVKRNPDGTVCEDCR
ncbi:hypothetical protein LTS18_004405 [Coniosporium uncinatum]|uniref:Uncharacterized protein n=1 Tax=Coniosporium uncinatum TaxID=93489 RepID=A0ACC3DSE2_9PEZI|nr:hypothetical protein LTS18_004405 [Coniosporium uncinatum]